MIRFEEFEYPSSDGKSRIAASRWMPEGEPKAVVQILHGICEYVGRFDELARYLCGRGFLVTGNDHLGHGRTAELNGKRGILAEKDGWMRAAEDVRRLRELTGERYPGLPFFMLGHSMGSFLLRTYLIRWPGELSGAVIAGTGQEPAAVLAFGRTLAAVIGTLAGKEHVSPLMHGLAMGSYNRQFAPNRTPADWLTRDKAAVDKYLADKRCGFIPSVWLYRDMLGGMLYISRRKNLDRMDPSTPVYIYSGDRDPVGGRGRGVRTVYGYFRDRGVKDLTLRLYEGGRHEMHNEINRGEVFRDLSDWLEAHLPKERNI